VGCSNGCRAEAPARTARRSGKGSQPASSGPATVILAGNYGEAGAIDLYGPADGLPPALSPALTFWYWKPDHVEARTVVAVGFDESSMRGLFADVSQVETVRSVDGVRTEETGRPVLLCRQPLGPLDAAWPGLRGLS
jgi:hypothetical protein